MVKDLSGCLIKDVELDGRGGKGCKDLSISALVG